MAQRGISSSNKIVVFQKKRLYNLMCIKTKKLGWKETHKGGMEDLQETITVDQTQVLKI
jgi:hypothetical protein